MSPTTPAAEWVDGFAGPGGWNEGARLAGHTGTSLGVEINPAAAATAEAAGHPRVVADVEAYPIERHAGADGVRLSPVCPTWSTAGNGAGAVDRPAVHERIAAFGTGRKPRVVEWVDPRSRLTAEPMRWIAAVRPRVFALEQVPGALDMFEHIGAIARGLGYNVWSGVLDAQDYGVPSSRKRAICFGRRDGLPVARPVPTGRVTMGEALGVDDGRVLVSNYGTGGDSARRGRRTLDQPAFTMTGKCCRNRWEWPDGSSRTLTLAEAAVLNGFRADYPFAGTRTEQQQQLGDAVPPPLAAAVLAPLLVAVPELVGSAA
jgi:DNA (cytosine-5)-methyltransferase 1